MEGAPNESHRAAEDEIGRTPSELHDDPVDDGKSQECGEARSRVGDGHRGCRALSEAARQNREDCIGTRTMAPNAADHAKDEPVCVRRSDQRHAT